MITMSWRVGPGRSHDGSSENYVIVPIVRGAWTGPDRCGPRFLDFSPHVCGGACSDPGEARSVDGRRRGLSMV